MMAYNNKIIKRDQRQNPVPQIFNPAIDDYEVLTKTEFFGKSTDIKPANASVPVGSTFFAIDTATAYMNDGTSWVVI